MTEAGKDACECWAKDFAHRYGSVIHDPEALRKLYKAEALVDNEMRRAMAALDFTIFVTVLIHWTSPQVAQQKVREVRALVGEPMSRREYWNKLDRAHYYATGLRNGGGEDVR